MHFPRVCFGPRCDRPDARGRRPLSRRIEFEQLDARTVMSAGPGSSMAALSLPAPEAQTRLLGTSETAAATPPAGVVVDTTTFSSSDNSTPVLRADPLEQASVNLTPNISAGDPPSGDPSSGAGLALIDPNLVSQLKEAIGSLPARVLSPLLGVLGAEFATAPQSGLDVSTFVSTVETGVDASTFDSILDTLGSTVESSLNQSSLDVPASVLRADLMGQTGINLPPNISAGDSPSGDPSGGAGLAPIGPNLGGQTNEAIGSLPVRLFSQLLGVLGAEASATPGAGVDISTLVSTANTFLIEHGFPINDPPSTSTGYPTPVGNALPLTGYWSDVASVDGLGPITDSAFTQIPSNPAVGSAGGGWIFSETVIQSGDPFFRVMASGGDEAWYPGEGPGEPAQPPSIMAEGFLLDSFPGDPGSSTVGISLGLQEVAELTPLENSSLALVATLSSVSSDSPTEGLDGDVSSGAWAGPDPSSAMHPTWAVFVIGLDDAFERSREVCVKILLDDAEKVGREGGVIDAEGSSGWHHPISLAPEVGSRSDDATSFGESDLNNYTSTNQCQIARRCLETGSPPDLDGVQTRIGRAEMMAWAASGSALVAGSLWARRQLRRLKCTRNDKLQVFSGRDSHSSAGSLRSETIGAAAVVKRRHSLS
jgi:hypothetical protein